MYIFDSTSYQYAFADAVRSSFVFLYIRLLYREAVKLSMHTGNKDTLTHAVKGLVKCMSEDWGRAEVEASIFSAALQITK